MTNPSLLHVGWTRTKKYLPAVITASVMYGGIDQILGVLKYLIAGVVLEGINAVIRQGFRDRIPLPDYFIEVPWQYHTKVAAEGVIVLVIGMFVGLWANARKSPRGCIVTKEKQSPRDGEG
jgi:hypothetical protein